MEQYFARLLGGYLAEANFDVYFVSISYYYPISLAPLTDPILSMLTYIR